MTSQQRSYVKTVATGIHLYSFNKRFTEELSDHYDDTLNCKEFRSDLSHSSEESVEQLMGDPSTVAKKYNIIMEQLFSPYVRRHIIFIVLFSIVALLASLYIPLTLDMYFFPHGMDSSRSDQLQYFLYYIVTISASCILLSTYYFFAVSPLVFTLQQHQHRRKLIGVLLVVPLLYVVMNTGVVIVDVVMMVQNNTGDLPFGFFGESLLRIAKAWLILFTSFFTMRWSLRTSTKMLVQRHWFLNVQVLSIFFWTLLGVSAVLWFMSLWFDWAVFPGVGIVGGVVYFFLFVIHAIASLLLGTLFSVVVVEWILFVGLLLLGFFALWLVGQSVYDRLRSVDTHPWPWLASVAVVYLFGLLFLMPDQTLNVEWQVPAASISEHIERQQLGPVYRFSSFLNADEGRAFFYSIGRDADALIIDQNSGQRFVLSDIQSVQQYRLIDKMNVQNKQLNWSSGYVGFSSPFFACVYPEGEGPYDSPSNTALPCVALKYNDTVLFEQKRPVMVGNIMLSTDGAYALVEVTTGPYDPHEVYLIEL